MCQHVDAIPFNDINKHASACDQHADTRLLIHDENVNACDQNAFTNSICDIDECLYSSQDLCNVIQDPTKYHISKEINKNKSTSSDVENKMNGFVVHKNSKKKNEMKLKLTDEVNLSSSVNENDDTTINVVSNKCLLNVLSNKSNCISNNCNCYTPIMKRNENDRKKENLNLNSFRCDFITSK